MPWLWLVLMFWMMKLWLDVSSMMKLHVGMGGIDRMLSPLHESFKISLTQIKMCILDYHRVYLTHKPGQHMPSHTSIPTLTLKATVPSQKVQYLQDRSCCNKQKQATKAQIWMTSFRMQHKKKGHNLGTNKSSRRDPHPRNINPGFLDICRASLVLDLSTSISSTWVGDQFLAVGPPGWISLYIPKVAENLSAIKIYVYIIVSTWLVLYCYSSVDSRQLLHLKV